MKEIGEYLESKEGEVVDIMMTLFDDEQILKAYAKATLPAVVSPTPTGNFAVSVSTCCSMVPLTRRWW